ncbi:L-glutamate gamma-semialdehyde dehydrogenase [Moheibacter sediminis]|uniref:L-glutamate gamma-semialdehyde dehydrogenase n=1 Tax=Moheibacter sediminis TaxID=1434700 RepID=A0A1W1ZSC8_9FLAO|nr:L-glutamate gamma-semialdehyde dehydrogenase [Moheibacter sediminis]SMC50958.1 delta-1-pyrroline-5-carboxylate dehydrogenase [Moheibacter sediminis]
MPKGIYQVPFVGNEPVKSYAPGSSERKELLATYKKMYKETIEVPQYIGSEEIFSGNKKEIRPPHDHQHIVGYYHAGQASDVAKAIDAALKARKNWADMSWENRAAIFLKAADLIAGPYRARINAATMIGQSKNAFQAEIDAACEYIDFLRFNVEFMTQIYADQPISSDGIWNRVEYRPLEGFTFAITPFNFTAISGNLPASMALMGNVVVWKPSDKQVYSAQVIMEVFKEAGLPDGVINMILTGGAETAKICIEHPDFAGLHFTGSTSVFKSLWKQIGENINTHKTYPRIVGETGGKDFVVAHKSANPEEVATALIRGAFEYQGQKCSAASRAYISKSLWTKVQKEMKKALDTITVGSPEDFSNFVTAVIDANSFKKSKGYIDRAKKSKEAEVVFGGKCDDKVGYFIEPTVILTTNPKYESMVEEIFGPVLTIYVFADKDWDKTLELVDTTSDYALTGAIFAKDRYVLNQGIKALENSAGNFYINDKPTGAVVGQQPFGGARASGTNDKAGSAMNLMRWVSVRTVKETFVPAKDYRYPFLAKD